MKVQFFRNGTTSSTYNLITVGRTYIYTHRDNSRSITTWSRHDYKLLITTHRLCI